ncbi:hypothetical protein KW787_01885 [Candidatus Pacearchaeota archaeon]|nr:hypothetical protein [Candidatus Pacearchaeota archaeon]
MSEGLGCHVFEGERAMLVSIEQTLTIKGFAGAQAGTEKVAPQPECWTRGYQEAWEHGWACYKERILPWAIQWRVYREKDKEQGVQHSNEAEEHFKRTGQLRKEITDFLRYYNS